MNIPRRHFLQFITASGAASAASHMVSAQPSTRNICLRDDPRNVALEAAKSRWGRRCGLSTTVARPHSREEKDFVRAFANALSSATATIAADPETPAEAGSIVHRVREAYSKLRPDRHAAIQQRARARIESVEHRQRYFGAHAHSSVRAKKLTEAGLDDELKAQLKQAIRAHLDARHEQIARRLAGASATQYYRRSGVSPGQLGLLPRTTLEIGVFTTEMETTWRTLPITSPTKINLRWRTNVVGAETGVWRLVRSGNNSPGIVIAYGNAGKAPGGIFNIDLAKYLPSSPPSVPAVYRITVTPCAKVRSKVLSPGPRRSVGLPSNDVVIAYSGVGPPSVQFDFLDIFTTAEFALGSIHMVQDQMGSGQEEFYVAGFVQKVGGQQNTFGPRYVVLDPDGVRTKELGTGLTLFGLPDPRLPGAFPAAFAVIISILETDDGGNFNAWQASVFSIASEMIGTEVDQALLDYLQEHFQDYVDRNLPDYAKEGKEFVDAIKSLMDETTAGIAAMVTIAIGLVMSDIISGMADDYYGTEAHILVLPTNLVEFVLNMPGGQPLPGGGGIRLNESLDFLGHTAWPEATSWDGEVEVSFHWELRSRATV
jgi:hypothetical protein